MINSLLLRSKSTKIVYLLILTITFGIVYSCVFDKKVSLAGDNASYYILGKAIAEGEGYTNIHHQAKEAHDHYPPGYPLLIASIISIASDDIISVKIANGIFFFIAILLLFFIILRLTANLHIAFVSSLIVLFNYHLLQYANIMMSEIPFLCFSLLSIWLLIHLHTSKPIHKNSRFLLLIACVTFAFYIRSAGLALVAAMILYFIFKKKWQYAVGLLSGFAILYFPWFLRNQQLAGNTYVNQLFLKNPYKPELGNTGFFDLIDRILRNTERYITQEIPSSILTSKEINYMGDSVGVTDWFIGFCMLGLIILGIFRLKKFKIFVAVYLTAFGGLLLIWPSVWYGVRFMLPVVPILIFLSVNGIWAIVGLIFTKINLFKYKYKYSSTVLVLVFLCFWGIFYGKTAITKLHETAENDYPNSYKNYFASAVWIQKNTPENSVTAVRKEGLFYLFSKKYVTTYQRTTNREAQIEFLRQKHVTHVVVEQLGYTSTADYLVPTIDRYPNKFKTVLQRKDPNTYVMQFLPQLGYSGNWEAEKRNGFGKYVWEDGQRYEGYWKNDVRHGKGSVYFSDGNILSGTWENGKLQGEVIKTDQNGNIIERSVYENNQKVKVIDATY